MDLWLRCCLEGWSKSELKTNDFVAYYAKAKLEIKLASYERGLAIFDTRRSDRSKRLNKKTFNLLNKMKRSEIFEILEDLKKKQLEMQTKKTSVRYFDYYKKITGQQEIIIKPKFWRHK